MNNPFRASLSCLCAAMCLLTGPARASTPWLDTRLVSFLPGAEYGGWLNGDSPAPIAFAFATAPAKIHLGGRVDDHVVGFHTVELPTTRIANWHIADLNTDGMDDLIAASVSPPQMFVLIQQADRTLELSSTIDLPDTGWPALSLSAGDVNGDGFVDIAFSRYSVAGVCFGDGSGSISQPELLPPTNSFQGKIALGPIGVDQRDAMFIARGANIDIIRYQNGTFSFFQRLTPVAPSGFLLAGGWRVAGPTDLLTVGLQFGRTVVEVYTLEDGLFVRESLREYLETTFTRMQHGDIDADGFIDLAFNGEFTGVLFGAEPAGDEPPFCDMPVFLGKGIETVNFNYPPKPTLADLDSDGGQELVLWDGDGFRVVHGGGDRFANSILTIRPPAVGPLSIGVYPQGIHAEPSFFGTRSNNQPAWRYFLGPGQHAARSLIFDEDHLLTGPTMPGFLFVDADEDGIQDIVSVSRYPSNLMSYRFGEGDGEFRPPLSAVSSFYILESFITADIDGNKQVDILAPTSSLNGITACFGEESGVLAEPVSLGIQSPSSSGFSFGAGDLTGDGRDAIVVSAMGELTAYSFDGNRQLVAARSYQGPPVGQPTDRRLLVSDLSGDGLADVIVPTAYSATYFESIGPDTFESPRPLDLLRSARLTRTADLNNDGFPEILVTTEKGLEVHGFDTARKFVPMARTPQYAEATDLVTTDLNGDGRLDLVVYEEGLISVVFGVARPGCRADFSHDGRLDFFDVVRFLTDYQNENRFADLLTDGKLDFFDISAFLRLYTEGCQ